MTRSMEAPTSKPCSTLSPDILRAMYAQMLQIRETEERLADMVAAGEVHCPCHLYSGEEALAVGFCSALQPKDYVFGNHRSHGHYLAKGGSLTALFAEILGRENGCSRGRGGSMHLIDVGAGMLGSAPIVGGTVSLALGAALASSIRQDGRVTVSFFGDGATGEGVLYESLNFAALRRLSLIFVCENNLYSTHLPIAEIRAMPEIYKVARPFGVVGLRVDGNDVLKVHQIARWAVAHCNRGLGPVLIEGVTYRQRGHVGPDDNIQGMHSDIRPPAEIERWQKRDPLIRFARYLRRNRILTEIQLKAMQQAARDEVEQAYRNAVNSAYPSPKALNNYVFSD